MKVAYIIEVDFPSDVKSDQADQILTTCLKQNGKDLKIKLIERFQYITVSKQKILEIDGIE